jgi:mono/diheme cytochrome c family protein
MRIARSILALTLSIAASAANAEQLGNAADGLAYARAHCGECHGVEADQEDFSPNIDAPDFAVVANTPGMTERAVSVWLQTSHPTMPNLMIPDDVRDDLIAYIMSLKSPAKP